MENLDINNITQLIYTILREVESGKEPTAAQLDVTQDDFVKAAKIIKQEEYLDNVGIAATVVFLGNNNLTMKGYKFLEENSALSEKE